MKAIGIICEYNPFHNGHLYHINKIKEMYPDSIIVLVLSGSFLQRGEVSILNKWDKTDIALNNGIDLVVELPFVFASQSADVFAHGSIQTLNYLGVDTLVFGSEIDDVSILYKCAVMENSEQYSLVLKKYLDKGVSYPSAVSKTLVELGGYKIESPNDLLGISYIKEIIRLGSNIEYVSIKRTNNYHGGELKGSIISASSIRKALKDGIDIKEYVPNDTYRRLDNYVDLEDYYKLIRYKILSDQDLSIYQTVDEGIEYRVLKYIGCSKTLEDLILNIKSKRYTYNRIKRMLVHILCGFTKVENERNKDIRYIRVLGFNGVGKKHLNKVKKNCEVSIITGYSNIKDEMLDIEYRVNEIYTCIFNDEKRAFLHKREIDKPIIKP